MLDYYHYTKDPSYNDIIIEALLGPTNLGPNNDYMPPEHELEEGNDDLFFWGSAVISAAERNFPQPNKALPSWLGIGANVFNELVGRWNTTHCGGGLQWQIFPENPNGMDYKNSVSNGGFFQLAARMARATGNSTYLDWAEYIWNWSYEIGFIDNENYHVYDGTDSKNNCSEINHHSFSYTSGIYLYGAAVLANHTDDAKWADRAERLLGGTDWFFSPFENATSIMYEAACETVGTCNWDMSTFKGYLSRFMWQSTQMMPSLRPKVEEFLLPSAKAAAKSCTGGKNGRTCGMKWYIDEYDGNPGLGQQMCALEIIQGLLIDETDAPLAGDYIKVVRDTEWEPLDTYRRDGDNGTKTISDKGADHPTTSSDPSATESDDAAGSLGVDSRMVFFGLGTALFTWGLL